MPLNWQPASITLLVHTLATEDDVMQVLSKVGTLQIRTTLFSL